MRNAIGLVVGLVMLPLWASASIDWNNAAGGAWEDNSKWAGGVAPTNGAIQVVINNASSKTVTISASTPAGGLSINDLFIQSGLAGETNTLLLSGNTTPLTCQGSIDGYGTAIQLGWNAGRCGELIVDGGWLVATNAANNGGIVAGIVGNGHLSIINNGLLLANSLYLGNSSGGHGEFSLNGGTCIVGNATVPVRFGIAASSTGVVQMTGGFLKTTDLRLAPAVGSVVRMSVTGGRWECDGSYLTLCYPGAGANSSLTIDGGTNLINCPLYVGDIAGSTGTLQVTGGLLVNTNSAGNQRLYVGNNGGAGSATISGGQWLGNCFTVSDSCSLNLLGGTTLFNGGGAGHTVSANGTVVVNGGVFVGTNDDITIYSGAGINVSSGTFMTRSVGVGQNTTGGAIRVTGGQVILKDKLVIGYNSAASSNNTVLVAGGLLEANTMEFYAGPTGNSISNSGGVYQFSTISPSFTLTGVGVVALDGGTIAFREVTNVNVKNNWSGTSLKSISYYGTNTFRLDTATNATSPDQSYTFAANMGSTNFARLELVNATNCYRGGNVTVGTGGSILFSNTTARLEGSLLITNGGVMTVVDSTVTVTGACTLAENSTVNWITNAVANVFNVTGVLSLPTNSTFTLSSPVGRNDTLTLFTATGGITGSPANWTMSPMSHRLAVVDGNTLVLRPRTAGFVFQVQ